MLSAFIQTLLNGVVSGTILAVPAIGFTAMFALLRFGNFAVGALATVGAYGGYVANVFWGWPALAALAAAFATAGSLVLENVIRWFFANDHRSYDLPILRDMRFGDLRVGPQQLENFLLALAIMAAIWLFLSFTRMGRAMRAVADNPDLAMLKGIEPARMALIASNEIWLTNGTDGISGIPRPFPAPTPLVFNSWFLALITAVVVVVFLLVRRIDRSPYGRALRAIREDQQVAAVAPDFFQPLITIYIFLAVTAGGTGRMAGGVLGAYVLILFLEATRFAVDVLPGVTPLQAAAAREAAVGLALILLLRFRPSGLLPETRNLAPRPGDQTP